MGTFSDQVKTLTDLATALKASVDAETATITTENQNIDAAIAQLKTLQGQTTPDLTAVIDTLTAAKSSIDTSNATIQSEASKLVSAFPPTSTTAP